jgi:hypothetical protein
MKRSHTHSISIDAPVHAVLDLISDATQLPRWAPAFARVIPNGGGAELLFTQFFADGTPERDLEDARAVVAVELQTVRALCEGHAAARTHAA